MKSPSAQARARGAQMETAFVKGLRGCRHPQAEPVILSTGELVACVCIGCYQQLPADYIEQQRDRSHVEAHCTHQRKIETTPFGKADREYNCTACGSWISDSEWLAFQCDHDKTMEIVDFDRSPVGSRYSCTECGGWVTVPPRCDHELHGSHACSQTDITG